MVVVRCPAALCDPLGPMSNSIAALPRPRFRAVADEELQEMIDEADRDGDGEVNEEVRSRGTEAGATARGT